MNNNDKPLLLLEQIRDLLVKIEENQHEIIDNIGSLKRRVTNYNY